MKSWSFLLLIGLLSGCAGKEDAAECGLELTDRGEVRAFVIGHRHALADAESYQTYEASYRRHLEAIAPCLSRERPNLLLFPESAGLAAMLIGERGRMARRAPASTDAFVSTIEAYRPAYQHYQARFPEIGLARAMTLAVSDVVWRAVTRTFGGIAKEHGVWVMTNADVGVMERSTDPELVAVLGDPSLPAEEGVFVATSPHVYNSSLLFSPEGELAARVDKVFLTDPEEASLDLTNGSLAAPLVMETPFARIGVAISRDAWYPPFMQRLEDLGADLIVQPEAFAGGWTIATETGAEWIPDVFLASGWLHTQKHRTFRYSLAPQLTGSFFEIPFDGQVHIVKKAAPGDRLAAYVGQEPMPGFVAVGPWAAEATGREALRSAGEEVARSGRYAESMIAADLSMHPEPVAVEGGGAAVAPSDADQRMPDLVSFGEGTLLVYVESDRVLWTRGGAPEPLAGGAKQSRPATCARGEEALVVWQEGEPGAESIRWAQLDAAGVIARGAVAATAGPQWAPTCALLEDEALVVFEELSRGFPRLVAARSARGTLAFELLGEVDPSTATKRRVEGSQSQPSLSSEGDLVWIDYRDRSWDVYYARYDGSAFGAGVRIDGVSSTSERLHADPAVVRAGGEVVVAFAALFDRRPHPDIRIARSTDGVAWTAETVPGGAHERPAGFLGGGGRPRFAPDLAVVADGVRVVFQDLAPEKSAIFGASAGRVTRVDGTGDAPVSLTRPRIAAIGDAVEVVWEDDRDGRYQIYRTRW